MAMSSDTLPVVLRRIVTSACELLDAQYAALGVLGPGTNVEQIRLIEFITEGADEETIRGIGHYPVGRGILSTDLHRQGSRHAALRASSAWTDHHHRRGDRPCMR
jgi:hypothetical protein